MTILRFITINKQDYVGWNDEPVIPQYHGGCRSLYESASKWGGVLISDEKIEGWHPWHYEAHHMYGNFEGYGQVVTGALYPEQCKAAGFNLGSKTRCWRTGNQAYRLNYEQMGKYLNMSEDKKKAFLDGLYPEEKDPLMAPAPKKEGKVRKARVIIPF